MRFENNRAGGQGGGLYASSGASLVITSSEFISNSALSQGGGISIIGFNVDLVNSLFARNQSIDGAALALNGLSNRVSLVHNTIADTSLNPGQAIAVFNGTVGITDTIIVNHNIAIARTGGSVFEDYNLFFGNTFTVAGTVASGGHSLSGNPAFVNAAADNYHLGLASAAIDAGINAGVLVDFEGDPRPLGVGFDIGFDERTAALKLFLPLIVR